MMFPVNEFKRALVAGRQQIGLWCNLSSNLAAEVVAASGFDWLLLMTVLFHGFLGMRTVVTDYIHRPRLREFTLIMLYTLAFLLFVIGTQVILTLPMRGAQ